MAELKPCPFCGEMSEVEVTQMGGGEDHVDFKVVCGKCGTEKTIRLTIRKDCDFALVEWAMIQAVSSWNRRVDVVPCDVCVFAPPSSGDGKPCTICPAEGKDGDGNG